MASSSSAKKVARVAAKSGSGQQSGTSDKQRNWMFGFAVFAIIALGVGIVFLARDKNEGYGENATPPKANLQDGTPFDHWHAAFAINVCGTELEPVQDGATDPLGIHTHADGLIHIHPFTRSAAGERATLGKFFGQVGLKVTDEGFQLPEGMTTEDGGTTVKNGVTTCGGKEGELVLAHWADATTAEGTEPDEIIKTDISSVQFTENGAAYTLAFVPKGSKDIKAPSAAAEIESLGAADGGATPTGSGSTQTVPPTVPDTTAPAGDGGSTE